jgi:hypothetical protein
VHRQAAWRPATSTERSLSESESGARPALAIDPDAPPPEVPDDDAFTRMEAAPERTIILEASQDQRPQSAHCIALLQARRGGQTRMVGGLILQSAPAQLEQLTPLFLEQVATALDSRLSAISR